MFDDQAGATPSTDNIGEVANAQTTEQEQIDMLNEETSEAEKKKPWFKDRIDKLKTAVQEKDNVIAQLQERERQIIAHFTQQQGQQGQIQPDQAAEIHRQAQAIVAEERFNAASNATFAEGSKEFGKAKFEEAVGSLSQAGADEDFFRELVDGESPKVAAKIIDHLAQDLDAASYLFSLPKRQMAREIGRLSVKLESSTPPPRKLSNAPPPLSDIKGTGSAPISLDDPNLSDKEWNRLRREQLRKG